MLREGIANSLKRVIDLMCNLGDEKAPILFDDNDFSARIQLKNSALMTLEFEEKRQGGCSFSTGDFPIYVYHNAIARLTPIYNQLAFLEKHPDLATSDVCMGFATTMSNIGLMLGEQSLIRTEEQIWEFIPEPFRREMLIVCGPIGENFVFTVHFVKLVPEKPAGDEESATLWAAMLPDTEVVHQGSVYRVVRSVVKKKPMRTQTAVMGELKALQMLLCAIATNLAVEEDENEDEL